MVIIESILFFTNVMMKLTLAMLHLKVMAVFEGKQKMPKYRTYIPGNMETIMETKLFPLNSPSSSGLHVKLWGGQCKQPVFLLGW